MEFREHIFEFKPDYDGRVISTLLYAECGSERAILYIHGYTDYFFQEHLAAGLVERGYNFYAIDLRKYGRSLLEGQHPNFCMSIREYYDDLTASIDFIGGQGVREIVILGHSTGGLLASMYAAEGEARDKISALVLNSPFLEFNTTALKRYFVIPVASLISRLLPFMHSKPELSPNYARSVHVDHYGEWEFNTDYKPIDGFPLYFSWLRAVRRAQRQLHWGLDIKCPVLVLCSTQSVDSKEWDQRYMKADGVLNVDDIVKYSKCLGSRVSVVQIEGGMHDLFLSERTVRERAFETMVNFLESV